MKQTRNSLCRRLAESLMKEARRNFPQLNESELMGEVQASLEILIENNNLDFYYNVENIRNQQLVFDVRNYFDGGPGEDVFEVLDFLNLLWAQRNFVHRNIKAPNTVVEHLMGLPVTEKERHVLFCFLIKWAGGYPICNLDAQYKTTYSLIVREFLKYPEDTGEKEFCKAEWFAPDLALHGDLIHCEDYEQAKIDVLQKEINRLNEKGQSDNEEISRLRTSLEKQNAAAQNLLASKIHLSGERGKKIDYIRVINCLYELGFFKDDKENDVTKKTVFEAFGGVVNKDLSSFQNDLSVTRNAANNDLASITRIFQKMLDKQTELNNKK